MYTCWPNRACAADKRAVKCWLDGYRAKDPDWPVAGNVMNRPEVPRKEWPGKLRLPVDWPIYYGSLFLNFRRQIQIRKSEKSKENHLVEWLWMTMWSVVEK